MFETKGGVATSPFTGVPGHLLGWSGATGWGASTTAEQVALGWDGKGKTVLITGAGAGLGLESARVLASRGAHVVLGVRDAAKGEAAAAKIRARQPDASVSVLVLDLASLASVDEAAANFVAGGRPLHVLMLNAGVMACPFSRTKNGHEMQFGTNHLGHFALVHHLKGVLASTAKSGGEPGRVVVLSSSAHFTTYPDGVLPDDTIDSEKGHSPWLAYGQSKLCNVLFARELQKRWRAEGLPLVAVACHPGVIPSSELFRHITLPWPLHQAASLAMTPFFKSLAQGAATQTFLATSASVPDLGGEYFADCNLSPSSPASHDEALATRLWEASAKMCGFE